MPKSKLATSAKKAQMPPIDWLLAAVLERKMVYGYDLKEMAKVAGISYETMRHYIKVSPWQWAEKARNRVCEHFGIELVQTARFAPDTEVVR